MSTRQQVNGHMPGWIYVARVIAVLAAGCAAFLIAVEETRPVGVFLVICTLLAVAITEIYAASIRRRRTWVDILPAGLKVIDRQGEREIQDYEIVALAYTNKRLLSNGHPAGWLRKCRLWTGQGSAIELHNKLGEGHADPLQAFIDRVASLLKEGFEQALAEGVEVSGDGWTLTKNSLRCQIGGRRDEIPLANISAIHDTEGKLGVWMQGQELPTVLLPLDGRNAWMLPSLVAPYLRTVPETNEPPLDGLGRIIFKRRASRTTTLIVLVVGVFLVFGGIWMTMEQGSLVGIAGVGLGLFMCGAGANLWVTDFRCQEWGVMLRNFMGTRKLLYRDIESFTYGATRMYVNGAYSGTTLSMKFVPRAGCGRPISHSSNVQGDDDELDRLRDVISHIIADQMRVRLAGGEQVAWTKKLAFTQHGLIYRSTGLLGGGKEQLLAYPNYGGYDLREGYFYLFEKGKDKSVLAESVAEANFFPGFYLLLQLAHSQVETENANPAATP